MTELARTPLWFWYVDYRGLWTSERREVISPYCIVTSRVTREPHKSMQGVQHRADGGKGRNGGDHNGDITKHPPAVVG
jgi:hypothetical protein